jgi:hypothetical protein
LQLYVHDGSQQAQMPPRHPIRVGDAITSKPPAKIFGFANVKHRFGRVPHQIDAGALRQVSKKLAAQALYQRARIREQEQLCHDGRDPILVQGRTPVKRRFELQGQIKRK